MDSINTSDPVEIAKELLTRQSLTPNDAGCQDFIRAYLKDIGFEITDMSNGKTTNTWAVKKFSDNGPSFLFAGHTDVVSPGNLDSWQVNGQAIEPFDLTEIDGRHYGRGIADMKGGVAAMLAATKNFIDSDKSKSAKGTFAFLITSDEEGPGLEGTKMVAEKLKNSGVEIDYCLIGEPSSQVTVGDRIYYGHRGSHTLDELRISGKVGHVALGNGTNAAAIASSIIRKAYQTDWDSESLSDFVPTVFEVTEIKSSSRVYDADSNEINSGENVVPDEAIIRANWRYNPSTSPEIIESKLMDIAKDCYMEFSGQKDVPDGTFQQTWTHKGDVFQTPRSSDFLKIVEAAIEKNLSTTARLSTDGGTSDGRFISPIFGADVVEFGMIDATIHNPNENIETGDLQKLTFVYNEVLAEVFAS